MARVAGNGVNNVDSTALAHRRGSSLSPEQLDAAQLVVDMLPSGATWNEIAEKIGVHASTLRNWRADPQFQAEMLKRSRRSLREHIPTGHAALLRNGQKGDNQAIKMLFELTGEYTEAKMRSLLGQWMAFLSVAGVGVVRQLMARVQAAHDTGVAAEYNRPPEDEIEDAEVVADSGNGEDAAKQSDELEV